MKASQPHHFVDVVQATKYHESGEDGSFEDINIERKKFDYEEKFLGKLEDEEGSYHQFIPDYFGTF